MSAGRADLDTNLRRYAVRQVQTVSISK